MFLAIDFVLELAIHKLSHEKYPSIFIFIFSVYKYITEIF